MSVLATNQPREAGSSEHVRASCILHTRRIHAAFNSFPNIGRCHAGWRKSQGDLKELAHINKGDFNPCSRNTFHMEPTGFSSTRLWATNKKEAIKASAFDFASRMFDVVVCKGLILHLSRVNQPLPVHVDVYVKNFARGRTCLIRGMDSDVVKATIAMPQKKESQSSENYTRLAFVRGGEHSFPEGREDSVQSCVITLKLCHLSNQRLTLKSEVSSIDERAFGVGGIGQASEDVDAFLKDAAIVPTSHRVLVSERSIACRLVEVWLVGAPELACQLVRITVKVDDDLVAERARVERTIQGGACLKRKSVGTPIGCLRKKVSEQDVSICEVAAQHDVRDGVALRVARSETISFRGRNCAIKLLTGCPVVDNGLRQVQILPILVIWKVPHDEQQVKMNSGDYFASMLLRGNR